MRPRVEPGKNVCSDQIGFCKLPVGHRPNLDQSPVPSYKAEAFALFRKLSVGSDRSLGCRQSRENTFASISDDR